MERRPVGHAPFGVSGLSLLAMTCRMGFAGATKVDEALASRLVGRAVRDRRDVLLGPPVHPDVELSRLAALENVATRSTAMPQVALAWVLAQPCVTAVIVGASSLEQLDEATSSAPMYPAFVDQRCGVQELLR